MDSPGGADGGIPSKDGARAEAWGGIINLQGGESCREWNHSPGSKRQGRTSANLIEKAGNVMTFVMKSPYLLRKVLIIRGAVREGFEPSVPFRGTPL